MGSPFRVVPHGRIQLQPTHSWGFNPLVPMDKNLCNKIVEFREFLNAWQMKFLQHFRLHNSPAVVGASVLLLFIKLRYSTFSEIYTQTKRFEVFHFIYISCIIAPTRTNVESGFENSIFNFSMFFVHCCLL